MPADSRTALRCFWKILANGLVRLDRRREIENVNEMTFLELVCLTLFDQKGDGFAIEDG